MRQTELNSTYPYIAQITQLLGDRVTIRDSVAPNEIYLSLRPESLHALPEICSLLTTSLNARFITLVANDERSLNGAFALYYVFSVSSEDLFEILRVPVDPRDMEVPSISPIIESAFWFEREMKDWFGIIAFPNIYKLASHPDWPEDAHAMQKTFDVHTQ